MATSHIRIRPLARAGFIVAGLGIAALMVTLVVAVLTSTTPSAAGIFYGCVGLVLGFTLTAMASFDLTEAVIADREAARHRARRKALGPR